LRNEIAHSTGEVKDDKKRLQKDIQEYYGIGEQKSIFENKFISLKDTVLRPMFDNCLKYCNKIISMKTEKVIQMELTNQDKEEIIQHIHTHINAVNNGYCRVGWAIKKVMGKNFKPSNEKVLKLHLANMAIKNNKYIKDRSDKPYYDFDISRNTNYTWAASNPIRFSIVTSLIAIFLSVIASLITVNYL
jgi:hypothetical protein